MVMRARRRTLWRHDGRAIARVRPSGGTTALAAPSTSFTPLVMRVSVAARGRRSAAEPHRSPTEISPADGPPCDARSRRPLRPTAEPSQRLAASQRRNGAASAADDDTTTPQLAAGEHGRPRAAEPTAPRNGTAERQRGAAKRPRPKRRPGAHEGNEISRRRSDAAEQPQTAPRLVADT